MRYFRKIRYFLQLFFGTNAQDVVSSGEVLSRKYKIYRTEVRVRFRRLSVYTYGRGGLYLGMILVHPKTTDLVQNVIYKKYSNFILYKTTAILYCIKVEQFYCVILIYLTFREEERAVLVCAGGGGGGRASYSCAYLVEWRENSLFLTTSQKRQRIQVWKNGH
jgi:hypothetical protein